jgi:hypothetical protein
MRGIALGIGLALVAAACGGGGDSTPRSRVQATFSEWEIVVEPATVQAGEVTFDLNNTGEVAHNLIIVKSDLPPAELPVTDGAVDTARLNLVGNAGPIERGPATEDAEGYTVTLSPGKYVLFCDIVSRVGVEVESHYRNGMYTSFLVQP